MNRSKFSLADLLTLMGAVTFGFLLLLSYYFSTLGDLKQSILMASIFAIPLGILAYVIKLKKGVSRNFKSNIILEGILVVFFAALAVGSIFPFSHYFAISQQKEEIQSKIISNITEAKGLFDAYDSYADNSINLYERKLKSIVEAKFVNPSAYIEEGFEQGKSDAIQIERMVTLLKQILRPSDYSKMKEDLSWLSDAESEVENWSPKKVVDIVNKLNLGVQYWNDQLKKYSSEPLNARNTTSFDSPISFDQVSSFFTKETPLNPIGIAIHVGLIFLMLFSYLISKRHERIRGNVLKLLFGDSATDDKEL